MSGLKLISKTKNLLNQSFNQSKSLISTMIKKNKLKIFPLLSHKKIESTITNPFCNIKEKPTLYFLEYNPNININKKLYEKKYDIYIISFKENTIPNIQNNKVLHKIISKMPKFPIYLKDIIIIPSIQFYMINGVSNQLNNKNDILNDFIQRIIQKIGVIIASSNFKLPEIKNIDHSGYKDFIKNNKFLQEKQVYKVEKYMSHLYEPNNFGWLAQTNRLAIDYLFKNYSFQTIAEFGIYLGLSTKYILEKSPNINYYGFDEFRPFFFTDFSIKNSSSITPIDTNFFSRFMRFETFHKNIEKYKNIYSIMGDNYKNVYLLQKHKITPDFIYIDFEKNDTKLIKFVDKLFTLFPNVIILGDDAVYLNESLKYFEKKYYFILLEKCYLCSKKKDFVNKDLLIKNYHELIHKLNIENINEVLEKKDEDTNIYFIRNMILQNKHIQEIVQYIELLDIDLNKIYDNILNGNLYHFICSKYFTKNQINIYYMDLYKKLITIQKDKNIQNNTFIIPSDYLKYKNMIF
jgi:hypothetical protein